MLALKKNYGLTINEIGIIQQHLTVKGFNDNKRLLDHSQYFIMLEGKKISELLPRSCEKSLINGVIIPAILRRCDECKDRILCMACNNQNNENKEVEANLNLFKRGAPNKFGYMLP